MWVIPIGVFGIIVYSEMSGRVAGVSGKAGSRKHDEVAWSSIVRIEGDGIVVRDP